MAGWVVPLWTTAVGGATVIIGQQTYRFLRQWQKSRESVNASDHDLLHSLAAAMLGRKKTPFSKAEPGVLERMDNVESSLAEVSETVGKIWGKVNGG